jgi:aliphatic nitrilase
MMKKIKAACVQAAPVFLDLDASIEKAGKLCAEAAANGAKFIAFPETWLPGYPWWIWTDNAIEAMRFLPQYHENSMALNSPQMRRLQQIAAQNNIAMVMGYSEKENSTRYMSQVSIDAEGTIKFNRRKLKPTHMERVVFGEGDGSGFQAVDMGFGPVGALNCFEHIQPLAKMAMYAENEYVHVAGWPSFCIYRDLTHALGPEANTAASMTYALEGSCYVLASTAIVDQRMLDIVAEGNEAKAYLLNPRTSKPGGGYSMIFAPDGRPMCDPIPDDQEGILYADLDPAAVTLAKGVADPVGHYGRGDAVKLVINRNKRDVVQEVGQKGSFEEIVFDEFEEVQ